jgi:hypothetical protein
MSVSQTNGVPRDEATAKDFMQVRAALVKRLGGANEALVWTRIDWRADSARVAHRTEDGTHWWAATHPEIASETGLSSDQVRRAIEKLVARGFLREDAHHGFDRRKSYAPIYSHPADSPDGADAGSKGRDRQIEAADSPDVPLIETSETRDTPVVPAADPVAEAFEQAWSMWPSPRRGTRKKAEPAFRGAVRAIGGLAGISDLLAAIARDVAVWRTWPAADVQYVPLLSTWLNQERWTAAPPLPRSGTAAQQKQDNNLALLARYQTEGVSNGEVTGGAAAGVRALAAGS